MFFIHSLFENIQALQRIEQILFRQRKYQQKIYTSIHKSRFSQVEDK